MSEEQRSVWPWIVALLIGVPVFYVASSGPIAWTRRSWLFGNRTTEWLDRPFDAAVMHGPEWIAEPLFRYRTVFLTKGERERERDFLMFRQAVEDAGHAIF
jgi:hypothetical protein